MCLFQIVFENSRATTVVVLSWFVLNHNLHKLAWYSFSVARFTEVQAVITGRYGEILCDVHSFILLQFSKSRATTLVPLNSNEIRHAQFDLVCVTHEKVSMKSN